jgi:uncharacterized membrane protein
MVRVGMMGVCAAVLVLSLCSMAALGLLSIRIARIDDPHFAFLTWNLFLAWVPFLLAFMLYAAHRAGIASVWLVPGMFMWVLFLPNAPYLITDYIHLEQDSRVPLWYDFALLGAFSVSGLLLGFASVYLVQDIVTSRAGAVAGWVTTGTAFALCAVGIYVGRVLRFNSWDALQEPGALIELAVLRLGDPLGNTFLLAVIVLFTTFLASLYVAMYMGGMAILHGFRAIDHTYRRHARVRVS